MADPPEGAAEAAAPAATRLVGPVTRGEKLFAAGLLAAFALLAVLSMRVKNPTFDETAHLAAGISYVQTGDFRMNPEHPVLPKLLAGAAATTTGVSPSYESTAWNEGEQWDFAREAIYESGTDWRRIVFAGRLPMVAIGVLLGLVLWAWARALVGPAGAAVALALYAFSPNFLAHTRLVTTDVPLTFTVVAATACLWAAWRTGRRAWTVGAAAFAGLAMLTKFSAFSYAPLFLVLAALPSPARPGRSALAHAAIFVAGFAIFTGFFVFAVYGFSFEPTTIRSLGLGGRGVRPEDMSLLRRLPYELMASVPWPSATFAKGMKDIILYTEAGHPVYLLGMRGDAGWWWGSFVMLGVKATIPFLLLGAGAIAVTARSRFLRRADLLFLLLPAALVLATNVAANLGLGIRHLLPMFPFVMILAGWPLRGGGFRGGVLSLVAVIALLGWHAAGTLAAHPHYLPFFNEIARVSGGGARFLGDSNLDWGQDLSAAAARLRERGATGAILCYFGTASPFVEGLEWQILPPAPRGKQRDPWTVLPVEGPQWLALSVTNLQGIYYRVPGGGDPFPWLREVEPDEIVGGSIHLYEIGRNGDVQRGLAETYRRHGLTEEAEGALVRTVRRLKWDSESRKALAALWLSQGELRKVDELIRSAENPGVDEILELAAVRKRLGDPDGVREVYESGLRVFKHDPELKNGYSWWLQEEGRDLDRALKLATDAVKVRPKDVYYRDTLAMVRYKRHEFWEALEEVDAALALPGGDLPEIRWHRVLILDEIGRGREAVSESERILQRDDLSVELEEEIAAWLFETGG